MVRTPDIYCPEIDGSISVEVNRKPEHVLEYESYLREKSCHMKERAIELCAVAGSV